MDKSEMQRLIVTYWVSAMIRRSAAWYRRTQFEKDALCPVRRQRQ
jgi:hypothetical protein